MKQKDVNYVLTMARLSQLVEMGLLTKAEFLAMQERMIEKYKPEKAAEVSVKRLDCAWK